jgi:acyl-CoA synthetase (NDP forming)
MNKKTLRALIDTALSTGRRALSAPEAQQLCDAYGIPTPKQGLAKTSAEAAKIAARLGFPVVLKIVSDDILHKTEAGGVIVAL